MAPRKKKRKVRKKQHLNLFVTNINESGGIENVTLDFKYKKDFISKFGTLKVPTSEEFKNWVNKLKEEEDGI